MLADIKIWLLFPIVTYTILLVVSCSSDTQNPIAENPSTINFGNPREVTLIGYPGDAMEPAISRDGNTLFFNNFNGDFLPNGNENDTNMHYAARVDDITFTYEGVLLGASTDEITNNNELEGVPSMDKNNKFYFIRTLDYLNTEGPDYLSSIFRGNDNLGGVTNLEGLPNLKMDRPSGQSPTVGELNFDAEIHCDGQYLYFVEGIFSGSPLPDKADIGIATENDGMFEVDSNSKNVFAAVNTDALEYAPSISTNNLELYFTRGIGSLQAGFDFGIYVATRTTVSEPWGNVKRIENVTGEFLEAPSISFDGKHLYYHQKIGNEFKIYVVERQ